MPLDIFLSHKRQDINNNTPYFALGEGSFNKLMSSAVPVTDYPNINKISDFYKDTQLSSGEVKSMVEELLRINESHQDIDLSDLIAFLQQANDKTAFFMAD